MHNYVLAIDQGTTSTRALVVDQRGRPVAQAQRELPQIFPQPGWVEHDPEEIWRATQDVMARALSEAGVAAGALAAIGIANQRETTVVWERATGRPIHNAIVWQDRRTTEMCETLQARALSGSSTDCRRRLSPAGSMLSLAPGKKPRMRW